MNQIGTAWKRLTAPSKAVTNPLVARRLRVLTSGCVVVIGLGLPITTAQLLLNPDEFMGDPVLVYAAYLLIGLLYVGARSHLWQLALWSFVLVGSAGIWAMLGSSANQDELFVGTPLGLLPFAFAALLHRRVGIMLVALITVLGVLYTYTQVPDADGGFFMGVLFATLLAGGAIAGLQELARADHADLRQRADELEAAWQAAKAAEEARGRFLATVHHELRTPLNGILGASLLLGEVTEDPNHLELVYAVRDSGQRLHGLIEDVLAYVSEGVGELSFELSPTWVGSAVDDILRRHEALAGARGTALVHEDGRPPRLLLDEGRLRHVITHLVRNAITFTEGGSVEVTTGWDGKRLTIEVRDTGIGMTQLQLDDAFAPLRQGDDSSTRSHEGLGMGLSMSRALATAMGGKLTGSSEPGVGSSFVLSLPCREAQDHAA